MYLKRLFGAGLVLLLASPTWAVDLDLIDSSVADPDQAVIDALIGPGSGISVVPGSVDFIGRVADGDEAQSAFYSNFSLAPNFGSGPTVEIDDGVFLTSGVADIPLMNTVNKWDHDQVGVTSPGTGANALLSALSGSSTNDQNVISFEFTLDNPGDTGIALDLVFGSDEYPTQLVTDIFGFFVDGVNYAEFPSGELIGNNDDSQFIPNPVGDGLYDIEYNGVTPRFQIVGLVDPNETTHTAVIALADTSDSIYDSGAFIANLRGTDEEGGIGGPGPEFGAPIAVPATGWQGQLLMLLMMMAIGLFAMRARN